ncbi:MAG: hypothetical protein J6U99_01575 [Rikenellaceae bacterium]|nr:hypothetical protein [Rikenellaceae bacterium]MBO7213232.1 hypothetical protein [Rikenellaceae bacterium]MBR5000128.1 hypothetical protein [Rikenellaceae bacterium]
MKVLSIVKYLLLAVSVVLTVFVMFAAEGSGAQSSSLDMVLYWSYFLLGATVLGVIVFPMINLIKNPKGAMRSLLGLALLAVVLLIGFALSSAEPVVTAANHVFDNVLELRLSDVGLYTAYIVFAATILTIVVTEIIKVIKLR